MAGQNHAEGREMPNGGPVDFGKYTPELEAMLLEAVNGPHTPFSRKDLEMAAKRVRRRMKKRSLKPS